MRSINLITIAAVVLLALPTTLISQKVVKEVIKSGGKSRGYYLFVPEDAGKENPAPLIVMLHGSGRNGITLVDKWKKLAAKEGIVIVGPDASTSQGWLIPQDAPDFLHDVIEEIKTKHKIDARRVYLFGHSAGAVVGLYAALLESEYFAAAAVHAGAMRRDDGPFVARSKRKTPISIFIGTNDNLFPLSDVRATRDLLNENGFNIDYNEMKGHTHDYYGRSEEINRNVWAFLSKHTLDTDPKYERYQWDK